MDTNVIAEVVSHLIISRSPRQQYSRAPMQSPVSVGITRRGEKVAMRKPEMLSTEDREAAEKTANRWNTISEWRKVISPVAWLATLTGTYAAERLVGVPGHGPMGTAIVFADGLAGSAAYIGTSEVIRGKTEAARKVIENDNDARSDWADFKAIRDQHVMHQLKQSAAARMARELALKGDYDLDNGIGGKLSLKQKRMRAMVAPAKQALDASDDAKTCWKRQSAIKRIAMRAASVPDRSRPRFG